MSEERVTFTPEQQALVDTLVGEARVKARSKAEADLAEQANKDKKAAEQATLAAEQKWKELAEISQARAAELEPLIAKVEEYEKLIEGMLKSTVKEKGEAAKRAVDALPASMTALEKLDWLTKNAELFQGSGGGVGTPGRPARSRTPAKAEPRRVTSL